MNELRKTTITTLEVAEMMEVAHSDLLKKIEGRKDRRGYIQIMTEGQMSVSDFFIPSSYKDASGKENKCYEVTRLGCDFLANKSTGEKGVIFTARYVKRFQEMERLLLPLARRLGLQDLLKKYPYEVSGGQKQRTAVARALITEPRIVLADEPTGALDSKATDSLLGLFDQVNAEGQTILMVTHSTKAASHAKRVLFIRDGEVFHQIYRGVSTSEEMYQKISDTLTLLAAGGEEDA